MVTLQQSINKILDGSTLKISGNAKFGEYIDDINGGRTIYKGKGATVGKLVMNDGRMEVTGALTINGGNSSSIKGGTVIVNQLFLLVVQ